MSANSSNFKTWSKDEIAALRAFAKDRIGSPLTNSFWESYKGCKGDNPRRTPSGCKQKWLGLSNRHRGYASYDKDSRTSSNKSDTPESIDLGDSDSDGAPLDVPKALNNLNKSPDSAILPCPSIPKDGMPKESNIIYRRRIGIRKPKYAEDKIQPNIPESGNGENRNSGTVDIMATKPSNMVQLLPDSISFCDSTLPTSDYAGVAYSLNRRDIGIYKRMYANVNAQISSTNPAMKKTAEGLNKNLVAVYRLFKLSDEEVEPFFAMERMIKAKGTGRQADAMRAMTLNLRTSEKAIKYYKLKEKKGKKKRKTGASATRIRPPWIVNLVVAKVHLTPGLEPKLLLSTVMNHANTIFSSLSSGIRASPHMMVSIRRGPFDRKIVDITYMMDGKLVSGTGIALLCGYGFDDFLAEGDILITERVNFDDTLLLFNPVNPHEELLLFKNEALPPVSGFEVVEIGNNASKYVQGIFRVPIEQDYLEVQVDLKFQHGSKTFEYPANWRGKPTFKALVTFVNEIEDFPFALKEDSLKRIEYKTCNMFVVNPKESLKWYFESPVSQNSPFMVTLNATTSKGVMEVIIKFHCA